MDKNIDERENGYRNHPIVIFTGILVMYTASNSILALLNL